MQGILRVLFNKGCYKDLYVLKKRSQMSLGK